ncbi:MAG: tRNA (adenosine(37)-N6)-dimethylallyltransferase MiaA [Synergistaceae bacterium]|nr:tRNA (adenosine(37)-N6)-dimethylallyltransferase MiaA [Synergistaceae bacterium]
MKTKLVAIIGQTAVGKTEFSLKLAKKLNAEIISVDSRQVYRHLNVGADKISAEIRAVIPHHLIDVAEPDEIFSAADFAALAQKAIKEIKAINKTPLLVGGTPFYYKALLGTLHEDLPKDETLRKELEREIEEKGLAALHAELESVDPVSAARIHPNDPVRTMRAVEIYRLTGKPAGWWYEHQNRKEPPYDILYIGLTRNRDELYENIAKRVRQQFENGYPEEVRWLLEHGCDEKLPALQGFGYRELVNYLKGRCTYEEALEGDIRSTKAFSRRQMTWFKHFEPCVWYNLSEMKTEEVLLDAAAKCKTFLSEEQTCE